MFEIVHTIGPPLLFSFILVNLMDVLMFNRDELIAILALAVIMTSLCDDFGHRLVSFGTDKPLARFKPPLASSGAVFSGSWLFISMIFWNY